MVRLKLISTDLTYCQLFLRITSAKNKVSRKFSQQAIKRLISKTYFSASRGVGDQKRRRQVPDMGEVTFTAGIAAAYVGSGLTAARRRLLNPI